MMTFICLAYSSILVFGDKTACSRFFKFMILLGVGAEDGERMGSIAHLFCLIGSDYGVPPLPLETLAVDTHYLSTSYCPTWPICRRIGVLHCRQMALVKLLHATTGFRR